MDELPDRPGVFVVGNLVRSVLFVGSASDGIRSAVQAALDRPDLRQRARCIRIEATDDPPGRLAEILSAYRRGHDGALPPAQPQSQAQGIEGTARPAARVVATTLNRAGDGPRDRPERHRMPDVIGGHPTRTVA